MNPHEFSYNHTGLRLATRRRLAFPRRDAAQPHARRASTVGTIETESPGLDLGKTQLAIGASEPAAEKPVLPDRTVFVAAAFVADEATSISAPQGQLDRLVEPCPQAVLDDDPVDDHVNVVGLRFFQLRRGAGIDELSIDPSPHKPLAADLFEQIAVRSLLSSHERCGDHCLATRFECQNALDNRLGRLLRQLAAAVRTMRGPRAGKQQAKKIVDAGRGSQRAARIDVAHTLFDRQRGGQSLDPVDVRALHLVEQCPGLGRQGLEIPSLSLGEECIEGQRALAASADAGHDDEFVPRNVDVEVLQVVDARPAHADQLGCRFRLQQGCHFLWIAEGRGKNSILFRI